jgi:hypothetical protein
VSTQQSQIGVAEFRDEKAVMLNEVKHLKRFLALLGMTNHTSIQQFSNALKTFDIDNLFCR